MDAASDPSPRPLCWTRHAPDLHGVRKIWAASAGDVWAVGFRKAGGAIHRWDGRSFRTVHESEDISFGGVWGRAADDVWISGSRGTVLHWDGARFSEFRTGHDTLGGLWASDRNDVWLTGPPHALQHFTGSRWELVAFSEPPPADPREQLQVAALWGTGANDVWAVGWRGVVLHFDGRAWRRFDAGTTENLFALWGAATNDVWAAGDFGTVIHWDGKRWAAVPFPPAWRVHALWGADSRAVWAATGRQLFRWDGREWFLVDGVEGRSVGGTAANDVWVAEERGFLRLGTDCDGVSDAAGAARRPFVVTRALPERRAPDTSAAAPPNETEARAFVRELLAIAGAGDAARWKSLLSWKQRARGEPELSATHMTAWRSSLSALEGKLDQAQFDTSRSGEKTTIRFSLAGKTALVLSVTREDGALRLDEN